MFHGDTGDCPAPQDRDSSESALLLLETPDLFVPIDREVVRNTDDG